MRAPAIIGDDTRFTPKEIIAAIDALHGLQLINQKTHAVHAAAFYLKDEGVVMIREDIGRHNSLDKLASALVRTGFAGQAGYAVLTSRLSVELVQKAVLVAISAPTALAVRTADLVS
jgi:FdhD protein